jgi:hypothetical protein
MRIVLAVVAFTVSAQAGIVKGVVLEHTSSRPLARAVVRLEPVPQPGGTTGQSFATRAGRAGQFVFETVPPGIYLLQATRDGFFSAAYGQRLPTSRATPIEITDTSLLVASLRLRHRGALTGQVFDENGVGMAGITVVAYRARLPLRLAGSAESDDRGTFRIPGLDPGKYWVRSAAHAFDDGSQWLPTFAPQGRDLSEALSQSVMVDADTRDVDIEPQPGSLFNIGGLLDCDTPGPVTVTLSSETGRRSTEAGCGGGYRFEGVAAGAYEVFATLRDGTAAGFIELPVSRNTDAANVPVQQLPKVNIEVCRSGSNDVVNIPLKLLGRRQDLSDTEPAREIAGPHTSLAPGHWEFRALVPRGQYVESIVQLYGEAPRPSKAKDVSDWYQVFIPARSSFRLRITVSDRAGQIAGQVVSKSRPAPGAPVFLWPVTESARRSLSSPIPQLLSNTEGRFRFDGLPPGDYRVLASFDVNDIDAELIELSRAVVAHVDELESTSIEVPVWVAPW